MRMTLCSQRICRRSRPRPFSLVLGRGLPSRTRDEGEDEGCRRRPVSARRRQDGFSLIEVMVAVVVLAIALTGLTRGLTTALGASRDSARHTQAVLLAASRIEQLRAESDWSVGETEGKAEAFRWRQTIAATAVEGLHEVKVAVSRPPEEAPIFLLTTLLYQAPSDLPAGKDKDKTADPARARRKNRRNP